MAKTKFPMVALPGLAVALAAGAGFVHAASVEPVAAYGLQAFQLEASTVADTATTVFERADLDNDGDLSREEYLTLAVVTAELARLNGFVAVDYTGGVRIASLPRASAWSADERARIEAAAGQDYALFAGDDRRLSVDEFVSARLEAMIAADLDRNGVLRGVELARFAAIEARATNRQS